MGKPCTRHHDVSCYGYVVEADIKGFFDNMDHDWLMRMLRERIDDGAFLGLIRKWLKAGILETDGKVIHPDTGSPQGGVISPVLANVYLHYALDLWFEKNRYSQLIKDITALHDIARRALVEAYGHTLTINTPGIWQTPFTCRAVRIPTRSVAKANS